MCTIFQFFGPRQRERRDRPTRQEIGVRAVAERERGVAAMAMVAAL